MQHHEVNTDTLSEHEQAQLQQGIQLVRQRLQQQVQPPLSLQQPVLIRQLHRQLELLSEHAQCGGAFACKPGCASCCDKPKQASLAELRYIVSQLALCQAHQLQHWRSKIAQTLAGKSPNCPFLNQQAACEIYALRPAVCRKAHSYSAPACLSNQATIPQHLGLVMQAEALILGTQQALQAETEADDASNSNPTLEFVAGLHQLLNESLSASI